MAWDSSRPVPWQRLVREWLIYVSIMAVVLLVVFRSSNAVGAFAGLLVSGPLYLVMGFVLAKFGYQRKTLKEMRAEPAPARRSKKTKKGSKAGDDDADSEATGMEKRRPAPTKRTSGGGNRPKNSSKSKSRRR